GGPGRGGPPRRRRATPPRPSCRPPWRGPARRPTPFRARNASCVIWSRSESAQAGGADGGSRRRPPRRRRRAARPGGGLAQPAPIDPHLPRGAVHRPFELPVPPLRRAVLVGAADDRVFHRGGGRGRAGVGLAGRDAPAAREWPVALGGAPALGDPDCRLGADVGVAVQPRLRALAPPRSADRLARLALDRAA